ncbi:MULTISPECIES: VIT1/CCC1 transporter family protein [Rhodococcus]|uniref:VIT1/CCC1 family predicted Fe2+/Mn2+ transporter n=1 Tax=Rhodococcus rhodochrous J45 TaxID=935266 RepID=A0A562E2F5_RHORH|nr:MULTISPECIES: VIT family protein [Rhodococcus]TWH16129.1 VIT1/CCC1 family predicted Fe2+/Mn2+ transporter [Rhodococcus rhodochrous J45]BDB60762.1 membrane protein [Rhodococcus sp. RDE2]
MSLPNPPSAKDSGGQHERVEPHTGGLASKLNWLRAGVLGANDGIVSTAGLVVGVAAATTDESTILTAGVAGLAAGAVSMALGEYVSVSTQRDTERAALHTERRELAVMPEAELDELAGLLERKGLSAVTARAAAEELTARDPLAAHAEVELGIDPTELANPWVAALSSAVSFTLGALVPLLMIVSVPEAVRIPVTFVAVLCALAATGSISAWLGRARRGRAVLRVVLGGALAMAVTYAVGQLFDVAL